MSEPQPVAGGGAGREAARCAYWRRTLGLTLGLVAVGAVASFLPVWEAPEMEGVRVFGWPLAYFLAAQGSLLVFVAIVWVYARLMDRLDRECLNEEYRARGEGG